MKEKEKKTYQNILWKGQRKQIWCNYWYYQKRFCGCFLYSNTIHGCGRNLGCLLEILNRRDIISPKRRTMIPTFTLLTNLHLVGRVDLELIRGTGIGCAHVVFNANRLSNPLYEYIQWHGWLQDPWEAWMQSGICRLWSPCNVLDI